MKSAVLECEEFAFPIGSWLSAVTLEMASDETYRKRRTLFDDKTFGKGFDCFLENAVRNLGVTDWHGREAIRNNLRQFIDEGFTAPFKVYLRSSSISSCSQSAERWRS
jgi:hypothetical protein